MRHFRSILRAAGPLCGCVAKFKKKYIYLQRQILLMERKSNEIEAVMMSLQNPAQVDNLSRFFKTGPGEYGEGDKFLGIKVPQTREVVRTYWKGCTLQDVEPLLESQYHEIRMCSLFILVKLFAQARRNPAEQGRHQLVGRYAGHTVDG